MREMLDRRKLLSVGLVGLTAKADRSVTGSFVNDSMSMGHRLRDQQAKQVTRKTVKVPILIVGGGMAGLSCAWQLQRKGVKDFLLLEMEQQAGGNARWGENEISQYPWAAHYVPVPNKETVLVRELMEEFGVLKDGEWNERHLCFDPQERLYAHGRWFGSIEAALQFRPEDRRAFAEFQKRINDFRASGKFLLPTRLAAADRNLDQMSMSAWLQKQGWNNAALRWYVEYGCRDDYGSSLVETSAWAGIHYFAARPSEEVGPITWPAGNGWLAQRLLKKLAAHVKTGVPVFRAQRLQQKWSVLAGDTEYQCKHLVWAAPTFLASYIVEGVAKPKSFTYSPWLVANLTLDRSPRDAAEDRRAWDNVLLDSPSLGYVIANHNSLRSQKDKAVWTYYWALTDQSPGESRRRLQNRSWHDWKETILADLSRAHPDIRQCVVRLDVMRQGHAMIRPTVGFQSSEERAQFSRNEDRLYFANSDVTGVSLFEQAQDRGVAVADQIRLS
jgi:protoporphyrinogen oxidase